MPGIVGVPYSGAPCGAAILGGPDGSRQPGENELKIACYQSKHVTEIAGKLFG